MTAAAELRAAAHRLRGCAASATPGPWTRDVSEDFGYRVGAADGSAWVAFTGDYGVEDERSGPDAAYLAAMHPGVALALATLLDVHADVIEVLGQSASPSVAEVARQILAGGGQ